MAALSGPIESRRKHGNPGVFATWDVAGNVCTFWGRFRNALAACHLASSLPVTTKATSASAPPSRLMATLLSSETAAQVPSCSATLAFCSSLLFFQCLDLGSHHLHRTGLRRSLRAWRRPSIRPSIPRVCSVAIGSSGQAVQNLPSP